MAAFAPDHRTTPTVTVTRDARVLCECGKYVYTRRVNGGPPAIPRACPSCARSTDKATGIQ